MRTVWFKDLPAQARRDSCRANIGPLDNLPPEIRMAIKECPYGFNPWDALRLLRAGRSVEEVIEEIHKHQHNLRELLIRKGTLPAWIREFPLTGLKTQRNRLKARECN